MSCSSAIYTVNNVSSPLANNAQVPFGSVIRRFGKNVQLDGNSLSIRGKGYYQVDISANVAPSAAADATLQLFNNGVAVPGAIATETAAAANGTVNLHICALVRVTCCDGSDVLTVTVGDSEAAEGTTFAVSNMAAVVTKI